MSDQVRILHIEDDDDDALRLKHLARNPSFFLSSEALDMNVRRARSLSEALESLGREDFDAVILDLSLPDSSCERPLSALKKILAKAPATPVIIITGLDNDRVAVQAIWNGAADYLAKDELSERRLTRAVRYGIERTRQLLSAESGESTLQLGQEFEEDKNLVRQIRALVRSEAKKEAEKVAG